MVTDKKYCMSSYLTFRYVYDPDTVFADSIIHKDHELISRDKKAPCRTATDIDCNIKNILSNVNLSKAAILLSGGMDSAILASYMPKGTKAYTARCIGAGATDETAQAKKYCEIYGLKHVVVDVDWHDYLSTMDELSRHDGSPIIPNEPQAYKIAKLAKKQGASCLIYGDCADTEFGGMDRLLSRDWTYDEWKKRFTFVPPEKVLREPADMSPVYDLYRVGSDGIDFMKFIAEVYVKSASGALTNAFHCAEISFLDPYERLRMTEPLDLARVRGGESKYLIRELFKMKYPMLDVPEKLPMSRPAEDWLKDWQKTHREEFLPDCVNDLTGEQKLLVY